MRKKRVIGIFLSSLALGALLSYPSFNLTALFIVSLASIVSFTAIIMMKDTLDAERASRETLDSMMDSLAAVNYYAHSGVPVITSIRKSAKSCKNNAASKLLLEIASRIEVGEDISVSIERTLSSHKKLYSMAMPYLAAPSGSGVGEMTALYRSAMKKKTVEAEALSTRYATCGMFVSTLVPSFAMFAFMGNILISQSSGSIWPIAVTTICAIPLFYSFINLSFERRLIG